MHLIGSEYVHSEQSWNQYTDFLIFDLINICRITT